MNSPGPLPPVPDDAPEHLVTLGAYLWVFALMFSGGVGNDDTWPLWAAVALIPNIAAGRLRNKLRLGRWM